MNILISAGHHTDNPGVCYRGFCEHDEATRWADLIVGHLGNIAIRVPNGSLDKKTNFINKREPSMAIEIHFNSALSEDGTNIGQGCETLYYPGSLAGKHIATAIQESLAPVMGRSRGVKEGWYQMNPDRGPDWFLARTACPAVIVEPEFIHLRGNIQGNRTEGTEAIAHAIIHLLQES